MATTLGGHTNIAQGLFIEMFLTAQLIFVTLMLAVEKRRSTYLLKKLNWYVCNPGQDAVRADLRLGDGPGSAS